MRKLVLSLFALVLVASPVLAGKFNKKVSVGDKAPDFAGIPAVVKGQETSLSLRDMKDDIVVVAIMADHCPYVIAAYDRLIDFAKEYEGKGVKVVSIAVSGPSTRKSDDIEAIKARNKDKNFTFAYGYDESEKVGRDYGATNTPQIFVLDKDRKIRYMGLMDDSPLNEAKVKKTYLKDAVEALLAGKEPEVTETKAIGCGIQYPQD